MPEARPQSLCCANCSCSSSRAAMASWERIGRRRGTPCLAEQDVCRSWCALLKRSLAASLEKVSQGKKDKDLREASRTVNNITSTGQQVQLYRRT